MQAPGPAERNQCEITRVVTAFDGDVPQRTLHIRRHDVDYTLCGVNRGHLTPGRHTQFSSQLLQRLLRAPLIQLEIAAQQCRVRKMFEHDMRVSDSRQQRATVTSRTWIRSCGFWSYAKRAAFIDPSNRSATCTYSVNVHHRNRDRHPGNDCLIRKSQSITIAKRDVRRRSSHIERDDFFRSCCPSSAQCYNHTASRT